MRQQPSPSPVCRRTAPVNTGEAHIAIAWSIALDEPSAASPSRQMHPWRAKNYPLRYPYGAASSIHGACAPAAVADGSRRYRSPFPVPRQMRLRREHSLLVSDRRGAKLPAPPIHFYQRVRLRVLRHAPPLDEIAKPRPAPAPTMVTQIAAGPARRQGGILPAFSPASWRHLPGARQLSRRAQCHGRALHGPANHRNHRCCPQCGCGSGTLLIDACGCPRPAASSLRPRSGSHEWPSRTPRRRRRQDRSSNWMPVAPLARRQREPMRDLPLASIVGCIVRFVAVPASCGPPGSPGRRPICPHYP